MKFRKTSIKILFFYWLILSLAVIIEYLVSDFAGETTTNNHLKLITYIIATLFMLIIWRLIKVAGYLYFNKAICTFFSIYISVMLYITVVTYDSEAIFLSVGNGAARIMFALIFLAVLYIPSDVMLRYKGMLKNANRTQKT